ncbi:MAG: hypothetical protein ACOC1U_08260, partial [Spirochaetota bacterium]
MAWVRLNEELLDPLMRFLGALESGCVPFTERLIANGRLSAPPRSQSSVFVRLERGPTVSGAVLQTTSGLYYPVLDPA